MAVLLQIPDGTPWWDSMAVWTVPGSDPLGPIGPPVAGEPVYVWARVLNTGNVGVDSATVNFYWANPSVGLDRSTATPIGTSFVTVAGGDASDVLCLTPWIPAFVNGGHECLLVEAFHPGLDPLPAGDAFDAPVDRHVAQRNLSVIAADAAHRFSFAFEIHNPRRVGRELVIRARPASLEALTTTARHLGVQVKRTGKVAALGFARSPCACDVHPDEGGETRIQVGPRGRGGLSIVGRLDGGAALLHIEQLDGERVVGGLSVLVVETR